MKSLNDFKPPKDSIKPPFKIGDLLNEREGMEVAIYEAYKGQGDVSPNPLVGCSVLDEKGHLLSLGYHKACGGDHAEIDALKKILPSLKNHHLKVESFSDLNISSVKGLRIFVTLEPCSFQGKTISCAKFLSKLPMTSLTYGLLDPHKKVQGRGVEILKSQGKSVFEISDKHLTQEIEDLTEVFLHNMRHEKSFVALKIATSLDGQIALGKKKSFFAHSLKLRNISTDSKKESFQEGRREWITNKEARSYGRFLRGCYDATLIGYGTLVQDNPSLNIRHPLFPQKRNKIILLDPKARSLSFLHKTKIVASNRLEDIFVVVGETHFSSSMQKNFPFQILCCPEIHVPLIYTEKKSLKSSPKQKGTFSTFNQLKKKTNRRSKDFSLDLDLGFLMRKLYSFSINSIYAEGGGGVHSSFLRQNQVQRVFQFLSPILLGAGFSQSWTKHLALSDMEDKIRLQRLKIKTFDDNILITGKTNFE